MNVLVVGNILKDVYLNLDPRQENLETDRFGTKWLNLGFDASSHYYFNRNGSFGGAAISMEILKNLGFDVSTADKDFSFDSEGIKKATPADIYRYIIISDDNVSYFVPTNQKTTDFTAPTEKTDYIYIDRSANLSEKTIKEIVSYLNKYRETKLALYLKNPNDQNLSKLRPYASLTFVEKNTDLKDIKPALDQNTTIYLSENSISFQGQTEEISVERIDKLTHLSFYSISAVTFLGGLLSNKTIEDSLKMARINVENSTLNSTLTRPELENLITYPEINLELIAASLMVPGKGILAADESGGSIKKKFAQLGIKDTFENRHDYRNIFFTTKDIDQYLSGVILFDETARDHADDGQTYVDYLISHRIMPGIKVDQGLETFQDSSETYTKGLDDLPKRLREYHEIGLRFAKWRAAFRLLLTDKDEQVLTPSRHAIKENCRILAEYAKACQSAGIVPIVEPEVIYDGYYSIEKNAEVTGQILDQLFIELQNFNVNLRACILKVNMIIAGKQFGPSSKEDVGRFTADTLKNHVKPELAGIVFLSGGQTDVQATENLAEIIKNGPFPWPISFSFARALQDPALYAWNGDNNNTNKARQAFLNRLIANTNVIKNATKKPSK